MPRTNSIGIDCRKTEKRMKFFFKVFMKSDSSNTSNILLKCTVLMSIAICSYPNGYETLTVLAQLFIPTATFKDASINSLMTGHCAFSRAGSLEQSRYSPPSRYISLTLQLNTAF